MPCPGASPLQDQGPACQFFQTGKIEEAGQFGKKQAAALHDLSGPCLRQQSAALLHLYLRSSGSAALPAAPARAGHKPASPWQEPRRLSRRDFPLDPWASLAYMDSAFPFAGPIVKDKDLQALSRERPHYLSSSQGEASPCPFN